VETEKEKEIKGELRKERIKNENSERRDYGRGGKEKEGNGE
jgi:hypothetical protein